MERLNSGKKRQSSETSFVLSLLIWRKVEEKHDKKRRKQEKIPALYWFFRNNLVPPSSSRSFRTQFHWSHCAGQCHYSGRFLQVHFITSDVQSTYFPSTQDWFREDKIWATDKGYSPCLSILWVKNTKILKRSIWKQSVMHNTYTKHGRNIRIQLIKSTSILLWQKDWSSIKHNRKLSFFPESWSDGNWRNPIRKIHALLRPPPKKSPKKHDYMKELSPEVVGPSEGEIYQQSKTSQSSQPNPIPDHDRTVNSVVCPQRGAHGSQEIETRSFREKAVNHDNTGRRVVCRDANHWQSMLNEVDINFRMPWLSHSVVQQAENSRVRELVMKMVRGDGVPKASLQQAATDSRGSRTCVCANIFDEWVAHAGRGKMNYHSFVVPSGTRDNTSSESWKTESQAAPKGSVAATWWGNDSPHLSWKCVEVTCKVGENGKKFRWNGRQLTLDKTDGSRVWWHTQGL